MSQITNNENVIDSRDVIARIEELTAERDEFETEGVSGGAALRAAAELWAEQNPDEAEELATLEALAEQCEGYGDWSHGETLVHEDHFQAYAQELAEECGMVTAGASWPNNCIDWEAAADQLKHDYSTVDFDGSTYYIRGW